jgi:hypothetical protein
MQGVECIRFPKVDLEKCKRWVNACKRCGFTTDNVKKNPHIYVTNTLLVVKDLQKTIQILFPLQQLL